MIKNQVTGLLLLLWSVAGHCGSTIDQFETEQILRAKTAMQVSEIHFKVQDLKAQELSCKYEISNSHVPYNCYSLHSVFPKAVVALGLDSKGLERLCLKSAKTTQDTSVRTGNKLSLNCARQVATQVRLNSYKSGNDLE